MKARYSGPGYVILTLGTLPAVLWHGVRGCPWTVIDIDSLFPPVKRALTRLSVYLARTGLVVDPDAGQARDEIAMSHGWTYRHCDMFGRIETQMERRYGFDRLDASLSSTYAMAARHVVCSETHRLLNRVTRVRWLAERAPENARWIGLDRETLHFYETYFEAPLRSACPARDWPARIAARALGRAVLMRALAWSARRLRRKEIPEHPFALAFDFLPDKRFQAILAEAAPADQVLLVFRNRALRDQAHASTVWRSFRGLIRNEGWIPLERAASWIGALLADSRALGQAFSAHPPAMRLAAGRLAVRRLENRALCARVPLAAFLARDDYNADHIVRTHVLRECGIRALGINHGLPVPSIREALWRYVDFDTYFVFGRDLYERYYRSTWAKAMTVVPTGSLGPRRVADPKAPGRDIVVFLTPLINGANVYDWAVQLARRFPDRTVTVKHKRSSPDRIYKGYGYSQAVDIPFNLIDSGEDSYDLIARCGYAVSTPNSTISAECLYYGLPTFVWDGGATLPVSYYRDFEDLCVKDLTSVIQWIDDLESGRRRYPFDRFERLIARSAKGPGALIGEELMYAKNQMAATIHTPCRDISSNAHSPQVRSISKGATR